MLIFNRVTHWYKDQGHQIKRRRERYNWLPGHICERTPISHFNKLVLQY